MRFATRLAAIVLLSAVLVPSAALAQQASITGVVRDSSGAVLPGVTVEASSPALIEQSRSVVTDGAGQYRIVDLRAGTYFVTFSIAGFTTVRREGIELTATFIATINADLRVAAVAETVTVSGESPIVDVQSSSTVRTINNELFAGIPSSRGYAAVTVLMPGISAQGADVGGVKGDAFSVFQAHGGRRNEGQVQVNGLSAGWLGMGVSGYVPEVGSAQEISFQVTGGLGEAGTGGPQMNLIPREGGNSYSGIMFFNYAGEGWQGDNLSDEQRALGLREINKLVKTWDINPTFGGPIKRDRIWFFATARHFYTENTVAGIFLNRNAGDATKWTYDPGNEQAIFDNVTKNASLRMTWQASPRNKVSGWWDEQVTCQRCDGKGGVSFASPLTMGSLSPEADGGNDNPIRLAQAIWTSPVNNRVLLEASFGLGPWATFGGNELPNNNRDLIPVIEAAGAVPGIEYRGQGRGQWARNYGKMYTFGGSLSYIAGAHRFKVGGRQQRTEAAFVPYYNNYRQAYNFSNTLPATLTMYANHGADNPFNMNTTAFYAQDHWTAGRLTLQGGLRFEHIGSYYPESYFAADRFLPVALTFPAQDADVSAKDINPRVGAAYDLFGTGKTSVKFNLGRYPTADNAYGAYGWLQQPANRVATFTNRNWNDLTFAAGDSRRGNYQPDCDLLNPAANGECGPWTNQNFGKYTVSTTYDPQVLNGWNVREFSWDLSAGVQHEIAPRTSLEVTYIRRSWGNQTVTDNRSVTAADFDKFNLTAPSDARLPDGGGYTVQGFYDVKPEKFGFIDNYVTFAKNFGQGRIETYNGVDITVNARLTGGLTVQGGFNVGQSTLNDCDVWAQLPEIVALNFPFTRTPFAFCDQSSGWLKGLGALITYVIPKADVQVAATFQSRPFAGANLPSIASQSLAANWLASNLVIAPALGRPLAGNATLASVNLVEPGTMYGDRINKVDFRASKIFRFGGQRLNVGVDVFNVFNTNDVIQYFQTFNTATPLAYLQPADLVAARFAKFSIQFDF
jgi:Carboxypeptidase regulatory-like domain